MTADPLPPSIEDIAFAFFICRPLPNDSSTRSAGRMSIFSADNNYFEGEKGFTRRLWDELQADVLNAWTGPYPGTRPPFWWPYSAPEKPRKHEACWQFLDRHGLWLPNERERIPRRRFKAGVETCQTPLHPEFDSRGRRLFEDYGEDPPGLQRQKWHPRDYPLLDED